MENEFKVGDKVAGELTNAPRIIGKSSRFEGKVIEVESAETSDIGEEMVLVEYTKQAEWSRLHGEKTGWHLASEVESL